MLRQTVSSSLATSETCASRPQVAACGHSLPHNDVWSNPVESLVSEPRTIEPDPSRFSGVFGDEFRLRRERPAAVAVVLSQLGSPQMDRSDWRSARCFAHCRRTKELPERDPVTVHSVERRSRRVDIEISSRGVVLAQSNREHKRRASDEFTGDV